MFLLRKRGDVLSNLRLRFLLNGTQTRRGVQQLPDICRLLDIGVNKRRAGCWAFDTCKVGMVGHIAFTDSDVFSQAVKAYNVLLKAIQYLEKCQKCAIAIAVDRKCYRCKKSYEDGNLIEWKRPKD